jgi:hypothetical protein
VASGPAWDDDEDPLPILLPPTPTLEVEDYEVLGTLWVVHAGKAEPEQWTLLDRPVITFGFCKE